MDVDSAATLRAWTIDVDIAGRTYTIPPLPAADWLPALIADELAEVVPGLLGDADQLEDLIADGKVNPGECRAAARAAIAAAAGMKWWTARRMARAVAFTWLGGELLLRGLNPATTPLGAYLAAGYRAATRGMDRQKLAQLDMELDQPPTDVAPEEWFDPEAAARGFMALAARGG